MSEPGAVKFRPLASGSKGNCLLLETSETKILIDAGLSRRATLKRLEEAGVFPHEIDAILVTHDHIDHIQGVRLLSEKENIPILANVETAKGICQTHRSSIPFKIFTTGEPFCFQDLEILPFSIQHDTLDPVGFVIQTDQHRLGIAADLGVITDAIIRTLQSCDMLYVEANHEPEWVHACPRPASYKQRVLSRLGHLSNQDCARLLIETAHDKLQHVYLAHLSSECNSQEKALEVVSSTLQKYGIELPIACALQEKNSIPSEIQ